MKLDCNVIKDLLPLYAEGLLSAESVALVEAHLASCEDCRAELAELKRNTAPEQASENRETAYLDQAIPLKKVKKGLGCRIAGIAVLAVVLTLALIVGYYSLRPVPMDRGESELYTPGEIDAAMVTVKLDAARMAGCKLLSLSYAGDQVSQAELAYANERHPSPEGHFYSGCIVINVVFRSPITGGGTWNANTIYHWSWILVRRENGPWTVLDKGFL